MVFGFFGSIVIAPIDCAVILSNTGLYVVPPLVDFHTPPLAAPMYTVSRPSSFTAASAAMRPLIVAEPIFRAPSPAIVSESNFAVCADIPVASIAAKIGASAIDVFSDPRKKFFMFSVSSVRNENCPWWCSAASSHRIATLLGRRRLLYRLNHGHHKSRIVNGHINLDFLHAQLLPLRVALLPLLDGKRVVHTVHLLVVAEILLRLLQRPADGSLHFELQLQKGIRVQIVVAHVAIFHRQAHLEAVRAFHGV